MAVKRSKLRAAASWLILLQLVLAGHAAARPAPKSVLVLYWSGKDFPANIEFDHGFQRVLRSSAPESIEYYAEYLESERFPGESHSRLLRDYLRQKYADRKIDVTVAASWISLDFLLKYRDDLFPASPMVFHTFNPPDLRSERNGGGFTGVVVDNVFGKTLGLALQLHPAAKQVFLIVGTPEHDKELEANVRKQVEEFGGQVALNYLTGLPLNQLLARVRSVPEGSIIFYVRYSQNGVADGLDPFDALALIAQAAPVPVYSLVSPKMLRGTVGGYEYSVEDCGAKAAEMVLRIAHGARPEDIPVAVVPSLPSFDWRQLKRWGIREDRLPSGSIIHFREPTVWQQYKWRIIAAIVVCLVQTILIGALLVERRRVRKGAAALGSAERVLRESEERFRNMADTAPVMIWVADVDGLCTFFNKGWLTFTGRTMDRESGRGWMECVHPDDLERCSRTYSSSYDTRRDFQMEYRLRRADGEYRWLLCTGVPRLQQGAVFAGYIGSCLDITDLKLTQEKALAGQKLESIGLLAGGIAHDFNNLLGGILACTELALVEHSNGAEDELLRIRASAIRGAEIVHQLMMYGGKHNPAFESVDLSGLVGEMLQLLKVSIAKHALLKPELGKGLLHVRANPAQIRQVVMNLVINASDAIGEKPGEIRVTTTMRTADRVPANLPEGDYVQLKVSDTGRGMTEEEKAKIFDPFFTTKPSGRGLGLAVVQGVVHAHGGAINVVSRPGQGTTFQVLLPCTGTNAEETGGTVATRRASRFAPRRGMVLVVEDEDALREAVTKTLRRRGVAVIEADDGKAAVELFQANAPGIDLVLLDMSLPGRSGPEVLAELQRIQPEVKVIVTSAYGQDTVLKSLAGLQPCVYLQKPYQLEKLLDVLADSSTQQLPQADPPAFSVSTP